VAAYPRAAAFPWTDHGATGKFARDALHEIHLHRSSRIKARCVNRIGWQGKTYVGLNRILRRIAVSERYIFQTDGPA
jgi:hypothetical protein